MGKLRLEITNQCNILDCPVEATQQLFCSIQDAGVFPIQGSELSVAFVNDKTIAEVHQSFMNDPSATDVITFPADPKMDFAGEIIVSVDHALEQSKALNEPFSRELSLYLIHGWLHLAGYDDHSKSDRIAMRAAEKKALALAGQSIINKGFRLVQL